MQCLMFPIQWNKMENQAEKFVFGSLKYFVAVMFYHPAIDWMFLLLLPQKPQLTFRPVLRRRKRIPLKKALQTNMPLECASWHTYTLCKKHSTIQVTFTVFENLIGASIICIISTHEKLKNMPTIHFSCSYCISISPWSLLGLLYIGLGLPLYSPERAEVAAQIAAPTCPWISENRWTDVLDCKGRGCHSLCSQSDTCQKSFLFIYAQKLA